MSSTAFTTTVRETTPISLPVPSRNCYTAHGWNKGWETVRWFLKNIVFPKNVELEERYDLKGSTAGRTCEQEDREEKGPG